MSMPVRSLAASVLLALSSTAALAAVPTVPSQPVTGPTPMPDAPLTPGGTDGNGGLIVSAYDSVRGVSITEYLGLNLNDFLPGNTNATPDGGLVLDFGVIQGWGSIFGASNASDIKYTVTAADYLRNSTADAYLGSSLLTTLAPGVSTTIRNNAMYGAITAERSFIGGALNGAGGCAGLNPCVANQATDGSYAGAAAWGDRYNNQLPVSAAASVGTAMGFYQVSASSNNQFANATVMQYANATGIAQWLLGADGHLTYSLGGAPVPLPAAVWLLLSGLVGMGTVSRRRTTDTAVAA